MSAQLKATPGEIATIPPIEITLLPATPQTTDPCKRPIPLELSHTLINERQLLDITKWGTPGGVPEDAMQD